MKGTIKSGGFEKGGIVPEFSFFLPMSPAPER